MTHVRILCRDCKYAYRVPNLISGGFQLILKKIKAGQMYCHRCSSTNLKASEE